MVTDADKPMVAYVEQTGRTREKPTQTAVFLTADLSISLFSPHEFENDASKMQGIVVI